MLKRILVGLTALLVAVGLSVVAAFHPPRGAESDLESVFRLAGMHLVEPGIRRVANASIEVRGDAIFRVETTADGEASDLEELRGMYVLPGLLDLHTHLPTDSPLALTSYFGLLYAAHGVTTVRDAGDLDGTAFSAAQRVYEKEGRVGPRILGCGPFVAGPDSRWVNSVAVEDPKQARGVIRDLVAAGFRCVKIYDGLDVPRIRALVESAREANLPALGHVPFGLRFEEARIPNTQHLMGVSLPEEITAGNHIVHRIMDWSSVEEDRMREIVQFSLEYDLVHTPTLVSGHALLRYGDLDAAKSDHTVQLLPRFYREVIWDPVIGLSSYRGLGKEDLALFADTLQKKLLMIRRLHEAGVGLYIGTDTQQPFVVPGASVWTEMRLWEKAGIPVEEIWSYATWKAGIEAGVPMLGRISESAPADFLVFSKDPSVSLDALDSLEVVVIAGRLYRLSKLAAVIEDYQSFYERWIVDRLSVFIAKMKLKAASRER